jgi:hypothetical protein
MNEELVSALKDLATRTNARVGEASWYLFGSAQEELSNASDIDLVVICQTHGMADAVRRAVDLDRFVRPIHLSILTKAEEAEICFIRKQGCIQVI